MDLLEIVQKGQQKVRDLIHGGVTQEHIEMAALDSLCDDILQELGEIERYDDVKRLIKNENNETFEGQNHIQKI